MSGPELCSKCNGLHYKTAPCIVRKPTLDVGLVLTPEIIKAAIGKEFSRPTDDLHPDRFKRGRGRPRTITDMKVYKAMKQREYRARNKNAE